MDKLRRVFVPCLALVLSGAVAIGATRPFAQNSAGQADEDGLQAQAETLFAGIPSYSVMKTENGSLNLSTTPANAFAPTTIPCPSSAGASGCTVRVVVYSQFSDIGTNAAVMAVAITGPGTLGPSPTVGVATQTGLSAHAMQWVKRNIPAGSSPTVTVQFLVTPGSGSAGFRSLSIDVMNGLL